MTLAISLVLAAMAHGAVTTNTIVVTPSNMVAMGWTHKATTLSHLPTQVAAECGFSVAPKGAVDVPVYGQGGFWANTGNYLPEIGDEVNQVFLGTNNYKDIKLSDITKLEYRAFTADFPSYDSGHYSKTPWQLQLAISKNGDGTYPSRYLMYRGWDGLITDPAYPSQQKGVPCSNEFPNNGNYMLWKEQYCCSGPDYNGAWLNYADKNFDGSYPFVGDWDHVLTKYSNTSGTGKLMEGRGYYPGTWHFRVPDNTDPYGANPTETCLSFVLGAPHEEAGSIKMSWHDNFKTCAWLDYFVIGYNAGGDPANYTEDWIYFRPDPTPGRVAMNNSSSYDKGALDNPLGRTGNTIVLFGKVQSSPAPTSKLFKISDGSGSDKTTTVKVSESFLAPAVGDYVRVEGVLNRFDASNYIFVNGWDVLVVDYATAP
jgi:hypothetical protein